MVTDIEGTTSAIAFVHEVLFPHARARIADYLQAHADEPAVRAQLVELAALEKRPLTVQQAAALLCKWMDEDRKATPLKALQGMLWAQGYADGTLQGHVYADVPPVLLRWHDRGLRLYVYSSGSVEAQKLIFAHTAYGTLTPLFSGYFDTHIGGKREAASYRAILGDLGLSGEAVLFLSDIGEELDAARAAGIITCQLLRDTACQRAADHPAALDFDAVDATFALSAR